MTSANAMFFFFPFSCVQLVLGPQPNVLIQNIRKYPHMHDEEYARARFGKAVGFGPLVLPFVQDEPRRIIYTIIEYDPLLDSSNMSIKDWVQIAEDIKVCFIFACFPMTTN